MKEKLENLRTSTSRFFKLKTKAFSANNKKSFLSCKKIDEIYAIGVLKSTSRILNEPTTKLGSGEGGISAEIYYTELKKKNQPAI